MIFTDVPASRETSRPPFDLAKYAADVSGDAKALDDLVPVCVPDVSWSEARLDFDELHVIRNVDAVSPVLLLETIVDMPRDQLRSILALLISRGILTVSEPFANASGFFARPTQEDPAGSGDVGGP